MSVDLISNTVTVNILPASEEPLPAGALALVLSVSPTSFQLPSTQSITLKAQLTVDGKAVPGVLMHLRRVKKADVVDDTPLGAADYTDAGGSAEWGYAPSEGWIAGEWSFRVNCTVTNAHLEPLGYKIEGT